MLVLSQADVRRLLDLDAMLDALGEAFIEYSSGRASVPPRVAAITPNGMLGAMPGYMKGVLETKLVTVYPKNHGAGPPSHQGLIAIFDESNGSPLAIMDGTYITAMRTGGAAAVSVRALARPDSRVLAILGAGTQGSSHLASVTRVRGFTEIRIASRTRAHAEQLAASHPGATVAAGFEAAVAGADVVCCCTDAREPILRLGWLQAGTHVTATGGTFGPELDAETIRAARIFVEWKGAATNPPPTGAHELQGIDPDTLTEMGEVLSGTRPGRASDAELTVYKSTGLAVEDAATARLVLERARAEGAGQEVTI